MLARNGCDVTGIDIAENAIADANAKAIERHVKVSFIVGDVPAFHGGRIRHSY